MSSVKASLEECSLLSLEKNSCTVTQCGRSRLLLRDTISRSEVSAIVKGTDGGNEL